MDSLGRTSDAFALSRVPSVSRDYLPTVHCPSSIENPSQDFKGLKIKSFYSSNSQNTRNTNYGRPVLSFPDFKQLSDSGPSCIVKIPESPCGNLKSNAWDVFSRSSSSLILKRNSNVSKRSSGLAPFDVEKAESSYEDIENNFYHTTNRSYPLTSKDRLNYPGRATRIYEKAINELSSYTTQKQESKNKNLRYNVYQLFSGDHPSDVSEYPGTPAADTPNNEKAINVASLYTAQKQESKNKNLGYSVCQPFSGDHPCDVSEYPDTPAADIPNNEKEVFQNSTVLNSVTLDKLKSDERKKEYIEPYYDLV